jgi:RNA polymerase sigma factor (sigma-70 family)
MDEPTSGEAPGPDLVAPADAPAPMAPMAPPAASAPATIDLTLLYARQRQPMVQLARLLTGSFEVAEELVQEAFVKFQQAPTVAENPDHYLRKIVVNLAWGHLRRLRLERAVRPERRIVIPAPELDETWAVVCRLPFRQRAVLALRYYEDRSEADIAQILGCRLGTVKSSHHRALATLKRQLS